MTQILTDRRDVDFVLFEQMKVDKLSKHERFKTANKKTLKLIISEGRNLAINELFPAHVAGDREGCKFENGKVIAPESFRKPYKLFQEGGWVSLAEDIEWGGQGMPVAITYAANECFNAANCTFMMYPELTHGAGKLIEKFGTDKQKSLYLKNVFTGKWGGTMLLTEQEAGSDVGAISTSAVKNYDGTYSITGNKIFISSGEHDLTENIIHAVLARVEGAPAGIKGISLFLVPRIRVNDDGTLGEPNDVVCTGIEDKMGIHGNPSCSLSLGDKGNCKGTLLGKENKGLQAMFIMMNEARLTVGVQALGCATASYLHALNYARERRQGKSLMSGKDQNAPSIQIIGHPDVRRQLLTMKVYVEGIRSLIYYLGMCIDQMHVSDNEDEKAKYQGLVDLLTPVAKGYVTDKAFEVCNHGIQVFGGYGYIKDYPAEQLLRDCRITLIYEGTNGIQAIDFLGRKLGMNKGKLFYDLLGEIKKTITKAGQAAGLEGLAAGVEKAVEKLKKTAGILMKAAVSPKALNAFAFAHPFLEVTGDVIMSWMLLSRAVIADDRLKTKAGKKDIPFYEGQIKSVEFFVESILPVTSGKMDSILAMSASIVDIQDSSFGGK